MKREIQNTAKLTQPISFKDMDYGKKSPTDIDAIFEISNKAYIIYEVKAKGKPLPTGQRICLERMTDDFQKIGKKSITIICDHETPEGEPINLAECEVRKYYANGQYKYFDGTVRELTDLVMKKVAK